MAKQGKSGDKGHKSSAKSIERWASALGVTFNEPPPDDLGHDTGPLASVGDEAWVALLLERKRRHPLEDGLQYWRWLERSRRRLVLVHAVARAERRKTRPRSDLTLWLGSMMERVLPGRFAYCCVELGSPDEAAQVEAARTAIDALRRPLEGRGLLPGH